MRTPKTSQAVDEVVDEVEHLIGTDHPHNIAYRLGYANIGSLRKAMIAGGRRDLLTALQTNSEDRW